MEYELGQCQHSVYTKTLAADSLAGINTLQPETLYGAARSRRRAHLYDTFRFSLAAQQRSVRTGVERRMSRFTGKQQHGLRTVSSTRPSRLQPATHDTLQTSIGSFFNTYQNLTGREVSRV